LTLSVEFKNLIEGMTAVITFKLFLCLSKQNKISQKFFDCYRKRSYWRSYLAVVIRSHLLYHSIWH